MSTTQLKTKYGYVYKYIDTKDGIVKYVGLVNPGNSLTQRVLQHKNDDWYRSDFEVYYIKVQSKTDAEFLESAFINHYKSYKYYNRAKDNWGASSLIDLNNFNWEDYKTFKDDRKYIPKVKKKKKIYTDDEMEVENWNRFNAMYDQLPQGSKKIFQYFYKELTKGNYKQFGDSKRMEIRFPLELFKKIYGIQTYEQIDAVTDELINGTLLDYVSGQKGQGSCYMSTVTGVELRTESITIMMYVFDECYNHFVSRLGMEQI